MFFDTDADWTSPGMKPKQRSGNRESRMASTCGPM